MAIDFPNSPALDDTYTVGSRTWTWTGTNWELKTSAFGAGTVGTTELADSSVTTAKLASGVAVSNIGYTPANVAGPTFTGTVVLPSTTSIGTVSATEIGYVDGVTSSIQTQLNAKSPTASPTFTGTVTTALVNNVYTPSTGDYNILMSPGGTAQGQVSNLAFKSTFQGSADNIPRRSADIWSWFNGGTWGYESLSFGVGTGATNDAGVRTTERMRINGSGHVTMPYQPSFFVYLHGGTAISATNKVVFNVVMTNNGSHWSSANNRFTAPVAGLYKFDYSMLSGTASVTNVELRKNNLSLSPPTYNQEQYESAVGNQILSLSAGDYIEIWVTQGTVHGFHNFFTGYLIG